MIPAGLDNSLEIYFDGTNCRVLLNGTRMDYLELPQQLREPFQAELISDNAAFNCIRTEFNILDPDKMEECFAACRYGALDPVPDLDKNKTVPDSPCCRHLADCKGFDIVCKVPRAINGHITRHEYLVICLVAQGKQNKEIADQMHIEINTVLTYLARIREKLCINNRIEIALWAHNKNIIASPR